MSKPARSVAPLDTLVHARELMLWGKIRHLVVISGGELVGLLSERDIAEHQARRGESIFSSPGDTVSMAMEEHVETIGPDEELAVAARRMAGRKIGCLPVLLDGEVIGMLTTTDILAAAASRDIIARSRRSPLVKDAMSTNPKTIHQSDSLLDAVARMQQYQIRHLPVVSSQGQVRGMISDLDLRTAFGNPRDALEQLSTANELLKVRDWMSSPAVTVSPGELCVVAARLFATSSISALPVVDLDERLVGILSYVDVLRALADYAEQAA